MEFVKQVIKKMTSNRLNNDTKINATQYNSDDGNITIDKEIEVSVKPELDGTKTATNVMDSPNQYLLEKDSVGNDDRNFENNKTLDYENIINTRGELMKDADDKMDMKVNSLNQTLIGDSKSTVVDAQKDITDRYIEIDISKNTSTQVEGIKNVFIVSKETMEPFVYEICAVDENDNIKTVDNIVNTIDLDTGVEAANEITSECGLDEDANIENVSNDSKLDISADNLMSTLEPQEWLDLDEFEKIVKELNNVNSCDMLDIEEAFTTHTVKKTDLIDGKDEVIHTNGLSDTEMNVSSKTDVICISSDEESESHLYLSVEDLDTISISSIEAFDVNKSNAINVVEIDPKSPECVIVENTARNVDSIIVDNAEETVENSLELLSTEKVTKNDKEIDTISLISNSSDYHSSDFEFITEDEAKSDGFIINYYKKATKPVREGTCKTVEVTTDSGYNGSIFSQNSDVCNNSFDMPGPSRPHAGVNWRNVQRPRVVIDYSYRQNHSVPEGDGYINLFQDYYVSRPPYMFENKSLQSALDLQYEGMGFDLRLAPQARNDGVDEECRKEAEESAKKILYMYPDENRKRRRTF